ncbi:MAG: beta-lactamase family protein [Bacteroidales bacterium]|nr:beta-lactamase family protein [Bacteroidales bacterium]
MIKSFFILVSLLLLLTTSEAQKSTSRLAHMSIEEVEAVFEEQNQQMKEDAVVSLTEMMSSRFNGSMIIARGDRIIVKDNFGFVNLYNGKENLQNRVENAITFSTFFELASVSKQFTAVSILQLIEAGKLNFDDKLTDFFPELPYQNITIHHLLTHTSGLPDYIDFSEKIFSDRTRLWSNEEMIKLISKRAEKVHYKPGARFEYTNTNYMLLASIVEKISGQPFEEYVREHVFIPAGMDNTYYITEKNEHKDFVVAVGHQRNGQEIAPYFMDGTIGDKGVYSTAEELFLWKKAIFDGNEVLSSEMKNKAMSVQNILNNGRKADELYGYGFRIEENPHYGKLVFHGGLWRGYQHLFLHREKDDLTIIFLTNWRNGSHYGKSSVIFHLLDGV